MANVQAGFWGSDGGRFGNRGMAGGIGYQGSSGSDDDRARSSSQQQSQSGTYFANPELVAALANQFSGVAGGAGQSYMNFINNPVAHPYFQNAYQGILAALQP